jgi:hypothetical protein
VGQAAGVADRYESYEPPAEPVAEDDAAPTREDQREDHQWTVFDPDDTPSRATANPVYVQNLPRRSPTSPRPPGPSRQANPLAAVVAVAVAVIGIITVVAASSQDAQPAPVNERERWEQCLEREQNRIEADGGSLLDPADFCSIGIPDGEEKYGDYGYDGESIFEEDDPYGFEDYSEYDWAPESP